MKLILTQPQLKAFDNTHSLNSVKRILDAVEDGLSKTDLVVLPEHVFFVQSDEEYKNIVQPLAQEYGCHILGGSYHEIRDDIRRNTGSLFAPDGSVVGSFDKLRPYSDERDRVDAGTRLGEMQIGDKRILVLICADFWFSDLFLQVERLPDLVLVPALSVTRKATPDYSRALWRNLAISRAYEFGVYVGISDWGHPSTLPQLMTSGVGGFADTTGTDPEKFYTPIGDQESLVIEPDFESLAHFRRDRADRGFFWKK